MGKMNIAVFFGSRSCEHDVSIVSALQLIEAAKAAGFNVTPVYISRDGLWYTGEPLEQIETFRDFNPMTKGITRVTLDVTANAGDLWAWPPQRAGLFAKVPTPVAHIDCAIPVFHGWHGEDGTIQGLFEMANIPYASTGVLGSAIGMDKIAMKLLLRGAGYPVLDFVWFTREQIKKDRKAVVERVEKEIKYPAFIKPAALGSSIGVSRAKNREELERALEVAASYDRRVLVEVGVVHPVEINCAALGYGEEVQTSVCEMPIPSSNDTFLDFWQKYLRNASTKGEESRGMKSLSRAVPGADRRGADQENSDDDRGDFQADGLLRNNSCGLYSGSERRAVCQRAEYDPRFSGVLSLEGGRSGFPEAGGEDGRGRTAQAC